MRMALVGVGGMGSVHLNVYKSIKDIEIVALVDIDTEKLASKADNTDIKIYGNMDELLENEKVDFIDICTPSYLHEEHSIKALSKGINVICEKPIALTKESADRIVAAAKNNNVIFMVAHVIRFWNEYIYLKKIYDENTYGKLYHASFSRIGEIPKWSFENWMPNIKKSGRAPIDLHIHDADFIQYMLGTPISVSGNSYEDGEKISFVSANYDYENCNVYVEGGWLGSPLPFSMSFRAFFENATVEYKADKLTVYQTGSAPELISFDTNKDDNSEINITSVNAYENELKYFIDCINQGKQPEITTPESSASSIYLIEKTLESAKLDKKVTL